MSIITHVWHARKPGFIVLEQIFAIHTLCASRLWEGEMWLEPLVHSLLFILIVFVRIVQLDTFRQLRCNVLEYDWVEISR